MRGIRPFIQMSICDNGKVLTLIYVKKVKQKNTIFYYLPKLGNLLYLSSNNFNHNGTP